MNERRRNDRRESELDYDQLPRRKSAPPPRGKKRPAKRRRRKRRNPLLVLLGWLIAVLSALVIALVLRTFVFTLVQTNSVSMSGTLMSGDIVVMTKYDYWLSSPSTGGVVAFAPKGETAVSFKRVVGEPGDTVELKEGVITLNGEILDEDYVTNNDDQTFMPITLPAGYYMLLGDNRAQSIDSRNEEIGLVAKSQIEGRARYIIWPPERMGPVE